MKVLLAGGSGFIGRVLAENFLATGHDVVVLGRTGLPNDYPQARFVAWDAKSSGSWTSELDGAGVLINLCGRSVDCRYSDENRRLIINSRVQATKILGEACAATPNPPKIWLNANTATIYADRRGELPAHDEESVELGHGFSVGVAKSWEKAFWRSDIPHLRKIVLRISIVLGEEGGAFPVMRRFAKLGFGGRQGPGSQWMSWLHVADCVGIIEWLIRNEEITGVVNLAAPNPITNAAFMRAMRCRFAPLGIGFPAPSLAVRMGSVFLRTAPELVLKSRKVVSRVLADGGYSFQYSTIDKALDDLAS